MVGESFCLSLKCTADPSCPSVFICSFWSWQWPETTCWLFSYLIIFLPAHFAIYICLKLYSLIVVCLLQSKYRLELQGKQKWVSEAWHHPPVKGVEDRYDLNLYVSEKHPQGQSLIYIPQNVCLALKAFSTRRRKSRSLETSMLQCWYVGSFCKWFYISSGICLSKSFTWKEVVLLNVV